MGTNTLDSIVIVIGHHTYCYNNTTPLKTVYHNNCTIPANPKQRSRGEKNDSSGRSNCPRSSSPLDFLANLDWLGTLDISADPRARRTFLANDESVGLAAEFYVIIGKFAELGIIHTDNFVLWGCAEGETGDEVHDKEDEAGAEEGVGETGNTICELVGKLDPVVVEPAAVNDGEAIEMCYVITLEMLVINYTWIHG